MTKQSVHGAIEAFSHCFAYCLYTKNYPRGKLILTNLIYCLLLLFIYFFFFAVACILQYFNFLLKFSFLNKKSERQGKVRFPRWLLYRPPIFTGNPAHLSLSLSFFCCQRCSYMLLNRSVLKASPVIRCWNTAVETNIGHVFHTLDLLLALKIFFKFKFKHFFIL